jgi:RHS repeat-associated protein
LGLEETLYACNDANMNVTALVNTSGTVVERYVYDAYGKATVYYDDWSTTVAWDDSVKNEIRYSGYRYDWETGLDQVRRRYYHPTLASWLQRDPIGYQDRMNLYQYVRSAPIQYVDDTGAAATALSPADLWQKAAAAVDARDWAAATAAMNTAAAQYAQTKQGPQFRKQCCCSGPDEGKCHIYVTHLAKIGRYVDAGPSGATIPRADLGYPAFPTVGGIRLAPGRRLVATVSTLVQLKHDDGRDTSGCYLVADCEDLTWRKGGRLDVAYVMYDFGNPLSITPGFRWKSTLNISYGGNWFIDTPGFAADSTRRFFQQHVTVEDHNRHKVPGLSANYGWSYVADWSSGGLSWTIWPEGLGEAYRDPQQRIEPSLTLTPEENADYWRKRHETEEWWRTNLP